MKSAKIIYDNKLNNIEISEAAILLGKQAAFNHIDSVNWPEAFPLQPDTKFIIARSDSSIFIHFVVNEQQIRAIYSADQDPVWQDSCVEFSVSCPVLRHISISSLTA